MTQESYEQEWGKPTGAATARPYDEVDQMLHGVRNYQHGGLELEAIREDMYRSYDLQRIPVATAQWGPGVWNEGQLTGFEVGTYGGGPYGAYGIPRDDWDVWAAAAGLWDANIKDPAAQDYVARWHLKRAIDHYGSWDLAAVDFRYGVGAATTLAETGWDYEAAGLNEDDVKNYLDTVLPFVGETFDPDGPARTVEEYDPMHDQAPAGPGRAIPMVLDAMSRAVAGGKRTPIHQQVATGSQRGVQ